MKRFLISLLFLSACTASPSQPQPKPSQPAPTPSMKPSPSTATTTASSSIFGDALAKRSLSLSLFPQQNQTASAEGNAQTGGGTTTASPVMNASPAASPNRSARIGMPNASMPAIAPGAPPSKMSADMARGGIMMPWFGGEFNHYVLQYAEENVFPAPQSQTLLRVYQESVLPLVKKWDSSARLIESRANLGASQVEHQFYLPGEDGQPTAIDVKYLFRLASSERKETLVVYVTSQEMRLHRLVWGEPNLDMSAVKIDSKAAQEKALAAMISTAKVKYPVYPEQTQPEMQLITKIPSNAAWQVMLSQQGQGAGRYYISVQFLVTDKQQNQQMVYGSVEMDAATAEIFQVNRPVLYNYQDGPVIGIAVPAGAPAMTAKDL